MRNEFSHDSFHENSGFIFRIIRTVDRENRATRYTSSTSFLLSPWMQEHYPEVVNSTRLLDDRVSVYYNQEYISEELVYADPGFFKMFSFPLIRGSADCPFQDVNSVIISERTAVKYFGNTDPMGKQMKIIFGDGKAMYFTVSGVVSDAPENSSLNIGIFLNVEKARETWGENWFEEWNLCSPTTYVQLNSSADPATVEEKLAILATDITKDSKTDKLQFSLQPLTDIYLDPVITDDFIEPSNPLYSYILSGLGILILLVACSNFIILSLGNASTRAKEIGVRKTLGAAGSQLRVQFLAEALLMSFFSLIAGSFLAVLMKSTFEQLSGRSIPLQPDFLTLTAALSIALVIGLIAGEYPALALSRFRPNEVMRSARKQFRNQLFGRGLVVFQFTITIFLIVSTFIMRDQMAYILKSNPGYRKEHVAVMAFRVADEEAKDTFGVFKNELQKNPDIVSVTATSEAFSNRWTSVGFRDESGHLYTFHINAVDPGFLQTMGIGLLSGGDFSEAMGDGSGKSFIINEAFIKYFGWENPYTGTFPNNAFSDFKIIGVVKAFNFNSFWSEIGPLALTVSGDALMEEISYGQGSFPPVYRNAYIRIRENSGPRILEKDKEVWMKVAPGKPYSFSYLEDDLQELYATDKTWNRVIQYAAMLSILISCLGLFGLSTAAVQRRLKEISIRKVLGSSTVKIMLLISRELLILVAAANALAWPAAYLVMNRWLQDFVYRTNIGVEVFPAAALVALLTAGLTISWQTLRAALRNPVEMLRRE